MYNLNTIDRKCFVCGKSDKTKTYKLDGQTFDCCDDPFCHEDLDDYVNNTAKVDRTKIEGLK